MPSFLRKHRFTTLRNLNKNLGVFNPGEPAIGQADVRIIQRLGVTLVVLSVKCVNKRVHDRNGRFLRLFIHGFRHSKLAASLMSPWPW